MNLLFIVYYGVNLLRIIYIDSIEQFGDYDYDIKVADEVSSIS